MDATSKERRPCSLHEVQQLLSSVLPVFPAFSPVSPNPPPPGPTPSRLQLQLRGTITEMISTVSQQLTDEAGPLQHANGMPDSIRPLCGSREVGRGGGALLIKKEIIVTIRPEQENSPSTSLLSTYLPALAVRGRRETRRLCEGAASLIIGK